MAQDKIILRNGEELNVKILENGTNTVSFQYPNETLINKKNKHELKCIIFSSGRKEECNQGINVPTITSKKDWKKVVETYFPEDVEGLTRMGELRASGGNLSHTFGYKQAINRLKKKAAKIGAGVILIHSSEGKHSAMSGVFVTATAYK